MQVTDTSVVNAWCSGHGLSLRGRGDTSLDAADDTDSFAHLVRDAVAILRPATVLDVGCGCGIPTLEAARAGVERVIGVDIEPANVELAKANVIRAGYTSRVEVFPASWEAIASGSVHVPACDLLVSNPPYVPGGSHSTVGGGLDGTRMLRSLIVDAPSTLDGLALLFSSISNPLRILALLEEHGWTIEKLIAHAVPFARYTSEPSTLSHLFGLRRSGVAFFAGLPRNGSYAPYAYLVLGVVASRRGIPPALVAEPLHRLLVGFQRAGASALRSPRFPVPIDVRLYTDFGWAASTEDFPRVAANSSSGE